MEKRGKVRMIDEDIKIAVLRIEGTNCEDETVKAIKELGVFSEAIHLKQLYSDMIKEREKRRLSDYAGIVIPGGFSAGDYVRAGAIFSARIKSALKKDLESFIREGYPVLGICNGFQVLAELGALPGFDEDRPLSDKPEMALGINNSNRFECRPSLLKHENASKCIFTKKLKKEIVMFPVAHAEGKVIFPKGLENIFIKRLLVNDQIVFRYVDENGNYSDYPWNPNGSIYNIAGICNVKGNVFGLMPHPERVFWKWQHFDCFSEAFQEFEEHENRTLEQVPKNVSGDGRAIFESMVEHIKKML